MRVLNFDDAKDTCEMRFASFFDFWENGKKKKDKKAGIAAAVVQKFRLFGDFTEPRGYPEPLTRTLLRSLAAATLRLSSG